MLWGGAKRDERHTRPAVGGVASAFATLALVSMVAGRTEKGRFWRIIAHASATISLATGFLVAAFGERSWMRVPVAAAFMLSLAANRRFMVRAISQKRPKRSLWQKITRAEPSERFGSSIRPVSVIYRPDGG